MRILYTAVLCFLLSVSFLNAQESETEEIILEETIEEVPVDVPVEESIEESEPKMETDDDELEWIDSSDDADSDDADKKVRPLINLGNAKKRERREVETLAKGPFSLGFFVGQTSKVTELNGEAALLMGGQAMFVFNHKFNIGGAGYGLVSPVDPLGANNLDDEYLVMGYGGMVFEPVFRSEKAIHFSIPVLLGAGAYGTRQNYWDESDFEEAFWVVEPGLNVNLNIFRVFQIGIGASYRYVADAFVDDVKTDDLSGLAGHLSLKFGWF